MMTSNGKEYSRVYGLEDPSRYSKETDRKTRKLVALHLIGTENNTLLEDNDIVVFLDGRDAFYMRETSGLRKDFANTDKDLFLGAEKNCWPFSYNPFSNISLNLYDPKTQERPWVWSFKAEKLCDTLKLESFKRSGEGPYAFPNGGGFIGRWKKVKEFVDLNWEVFYKVLKPEQRDDQASTSIAFLLSIDKSIVLDNKAHFIQCTDRLEGVFDNYCLSNSTYINRDTKTFPYFHHHNGGGKVYLETCMQFIENLGRRSASDCFWISGDTGKKIFLKDVCREQRKCCRFLDSN
ncbi:hypothetical protein Gasu2_64370 [Galdieria sulphuraria]|uniref:Uncharacterized protein n=1 Tax=Galdieria sulphuraria TaxID=130081 RepID=M2W5Y3_GALSU|nr:uncharacterized protein Gasu_16740 [Galdieria sulphuraria]EME31181.1 hypothetical protein Gasu_16740 [Galdieria sulphuraria]GJD12346.1 hypothetical protein Gasu2_64370 [Galdieria sulphuraria]|eukprot:XP_005707701.1 hypothetical protein Gasu_16740 [Galdieria sulphuraria]